MKHTVCRLERDKWHSVFAYVITTKQEGVSFDGETGIGHNAQ